jgi:hypothetical protein
MRDMRKSTHAAKWHLACDEEMDSLRKLNCWQVVPLSSVPPGTPIMGSRWTFKAKMDQHGGITGLRQIRLPRLLPSKRRQLLGIILTCRLIHYNQTPHFPDGSTALARYTLRCVSRIHNDNIDPTQPPIYCRPAEGYEPCTESVYLLKRYLYGMKDSPKDYNLHFNSVCLT